MNKARKKLLAACLAYTAFVFLQPCAAPGTTVEYSAGKPEETGAEAGVGAEGPVVRSEAADEPLPAQYDCRSEGLTPVCKEQGAYGTCWALAATTALEISWQKLGGQLGTVFSADHMALKNGFTASLSDGGDPVMVMAYLSGWQGPVTEEEDPYGDAASPDGLQPAVHVKQMHLLEEPSREELKEEIFRYGAVQSSLYMTRKEAGEKSDSYNPSTSAYFCREEKTPTHEVVILGWDDGYPAGSFASDPGMDGAFICQNSWGSSFGEEGIFYVSYADPNLGRTALSFADIRTPDPQEQLLQTDTCGWQGQQGYAMESCWMANVYTAPEEEGKIPELTAAGFYATGKQTGYELYVVRNFASPSDFEKRMPAASGTLEETGYYTVELDQTVQLDPGERFAVVCRVSTPGSDYPAAVEYASSPYTEAVTVEGKEGYLSRYADVWEETEKKFGSNVCLKACVRMKKE